MSPLAAKDTSFSTGDFAGITASGDISMMDVVVVVVDRRGLPCRRPSWPKVQWVT